MSTSPELLSPSEIQSRLEKNPKALFHIAGKPVRAIVEPAREDREVDHVWIEIDASNHGHVRLDVPTRSRKNLMAGFDPSVRLARIPLNPAPLPATGLQAVESSHYEKLEEGRSPIFNSLARSEMEELLVRTTRSARLIEAVGELYLRDRRGMHELHSRRASCAVPQDVVGRDGYMIFHLPGGAELWLLKFCGQV